MTEIKKYANRRLYDSGQSRFVTLENIAERIAAGEEITVVDAATGDDLTRSVLSQIVLQQEEGGQGLLPTRLLTQLIRHRNRSVRELLERTLPLAVDATLEMQQEFRGMIEARGDKPGLPPEMVSFMFPWLDFTEAFGQALASRAATQPRAAAASEAIADRQELLRQIRELREQVAALETRLSSRESVEE